MKKQITIEVDIPDGYEAVSYDHASEGEYYLKGKLPSLWSEMPKSTMKYLILKKSEPKRWRAEEHGRYFTVDVSNGDYYERAEYRNNKIDDGFYEVGNYFKTQDQAIEASKRVKEVLLAYQQELMGE